MELVIKPQLTEKEAWNKLNAELAEIKQRKAEIEFELNILKGMDQFNRMLKRDSSVVALSKFQVVVGEEK